MDETTQEADSTALLDSPQEVEQNVVTDTPKEGGDNLTLNELTTQLLEKEEAQSEATEEGADNTVPFEGAEQQMEQEPQQSEQLNRADESENDKQVLLDQYGINLDSLSEDEAMTLGRALRTESMKRFGKLTAQKKEAENKLRELENSGSSTVEESRSSESSEEPMSEVWTEETLQKKEQDLQAIEDWAEDALELEPQYDDYGEEYLAEAHGKRYKKEDIIAIRANARKMMRKGGAVEQRRSFLASRQQFDGEALHYFPWMSNENSSEFVEYQNLVSQERYQKFLDKIPEANVIAGLLVEGNLSVRERMKSSPNGIGEGQREKPIAPATSSSAAPKRASGNEGSRIKQAVAQAQKKFEADGSIHSLARLRELQNQMS